MAVGATSIRLGAGQSAHARQRAAILDDARFLNIGAGTRGGKTWGAARAAMRRIIRDLAVRTRRGERWQHTPGASWDDQVPFLHYWFVGPVYAQTLIQRREITSILRPAWDHLVIHRAGQRLWLREGVLIEYKSGDRPDALPGVGLNGLWITEAARLNPATWSDVLRSRLSGAFGGGLGWCVTDTTPLGRNWYFEEFWRRGQAGDELEDPEYRNHAWTTADNVRSPETVADVEKARKQLPHRIFRRDYLASWEAFEGQVYDEFSRFVHVVRHDRIPPREAFKTVGAAKDFGYTNPGVILVGAQDGDGRLWIVEESYATQIPILLPGSGDSWVTRAKAMRERWGYSWLVCDPSDAEARASLVRAGLPAQAAGNEVAAGIRRVSSRLHYEREDGGRPRIFISDRCTNLIRELEGLHYQRARNGVLSEEPAKVDDHAPDALRYLVSRFDGASALVGMGQTDDDGSGRRQGMRGILRRYGR